MSDLHETVGEDSPHTPSLRGMREAYHRWVLVSGHIVSPSELDAEFDRLIAEVEANALTSAGLSILGTGFDDATDASNWLDDRAERIRHNARCDHPKCPGGSLCCCLGDGAESGVTLT